MIIYLLTIPARVIMTLIILICSITIFPFAIICECKNGDIAILNNFRDLIITYKFIWRE